MPTQTFFNLPEDKKQRILDAAIEEFASYPFNEVSVAKIIQKANIPRGSFYQYFSDLKDLYKYLFRVIADKKIVYLNRVNLDQEKGDFLKTIRSLYIAGLQFAVEEPQLTQIANRFMKEDENFRKEIMGSLEGKTTDFYYNLLLACKAKGEIDENVDLEMAAFIFTTMNLALLDYFLPKLQGGDLLKEKDFLVETVDKMFYILTNGIKKRN
ncbi:transcriptional regulator, TetR family [Anaerobranca californiensis DSM 14826]|jgi:AcrR family transcriptional regulator|uniref:Transcriptional regulator, TetR family n=1 Tax=Anaerobranca californiensis DSM 14826 TaxID=1120989 RepID=A0A1M6NRP6_9FIRM|nr:TetR/AcrR family transcriptional regulator [Anaerobranca californiensis]SHJ98385.1 transcriptional regulator, TetR family [Anaerobranca californiensis DSM 14826]